MARYIKANPKVVAYLNLSRIRNKVKDGNYLLWQSDMLSFGPLTQLSQILTQIGAIALLPYEARQEQDGTITPNEDSGKVDGSETNDEEQTINEEI